MVFTGLFKLSGSEKRRGHLTVGLKTKAGVNYNFT